MPKLTYLGKTIIEDATAYKSILSISIEHRIPHHNQCGGAVRCTTCRFEVIDGLSNLTPRTPAEELIASQRNWGDQTRLGCQARIKGDAVIKLLVNDAHDIISIDFQEGLSEGTAEGKEVEVAVLFSDIRNFTQYSEQQLPFDVVHILNSYYTAVVECVLNNNGYLDKYLGDGIMAIFGTRGESKKDICTNAIRAAVAMTEAAEKLSRKFEKEFNMPLRTGIGIHFGKVIIGAMGHVRQKHMTVIGDTVNTACRVEAATKEVGSKILITENIVKELSGILKLGAPMPVQLKGKSESTTLYPCHGFAKSDPIALVQSSLELLTPNSGEFCDVFYGNLFRLYPETKTLFKGDMDQQSQMLLTLIASGVKCLNRVNEIEGSFTALGQRHIGYGVTLEDYDKIVDVMMITLDNYLGSQFTNDMRQAWEHVLKVIVRIMIQGAGEINT